ncbi:hypothetical protein ACJ72_07799, partial [Emergomyces africanus]
KYAFRQYANSLRAHLGHRPGRKLVYSKDGVQRFQNFFAEADPNRHVIHLAFHTFKHYSSVRNLDGPHFGLPNLPERLKEADLIFREIKHKEPKIVKESQPGIIAEAQSPNAYPSDMHWMITIFGQRIPANDDESIRAMIGECSPNITAALNRLVENNNRALPRSLTPSSPSLLSTATHTTTTTTTPTATTTLTPTTRSNASHTKSSTISPSSGIGLGSSSRSSSRHSVTSKRSANDSDLDDENGIIRSATRRSRGRCRKRRMLEDVTVDILGNRSEVFAIELNSNNSNYNDNDGDDDDRNRKNEASSDHGYFGTGARSRASTSSRTLNAKPLSKEQPIKHTNSATIKSIEKDDDDRYEDVRSDRTLSPSASQGSEASNSRDDDDDNNDEYVTPNDDDDDDDDGGDGDGDGDGDDDDDSDYKEEDDE